MTAQITLKKVTSVQVNNKKAVVDGSSPSAGETLLSTGINGLNNNQKIVFVGQDYKGTFTATGSKSGDAIPGSLELYLERPENYFKIEGVKVKAGAASTPNSNNKLTNNGKEAVIEIEVTSPKIISKDSSWFTTEWDLKGFAPSGSSLKFGEWNDFDLADKHYVHIDFV